MTRHPWTMPLDPRYAGAAPDTVDVAMADWRRAEVHP